ncbi:OmpH family outer membrane protein [bacterium]|nr:OmpH family outer membrane protein [bacterium]
MNHSALRRLSKEDNIMMNRNSVAGFAGVFAGLMAGCLMASGAALAEGRKYAVVDMQEVILNVEEGKSARADLEKEIKDKEKDLQKQKEELDKMNDEWKSKASLLSEEARMNKQKEFQEKFLSLRNSEMEFQSNIKRKEQKATQAIAVKVAGLVEKIAKERGLEAVFESNSAGLLYLQEPVDLTKDVVDRYSKEAKKPSAKSKK